MECAKREVNVRSQNLMFMGIWTFDSNPLHDTLRQKIRTTSKEKEGDHGAKQRRRT